MLLLTPIEDPITNVRVTHDGNCILASCLDNCVRLIDKLTGELLAECVFTRF